MNVQSEGNVDLFMCIFLPQNWKEHVRLWLFEENRDVEDGLASEGYNLILWSTCTKPVRHSRQYSTTCFNLRSIIHRTVLGLRRLICIHVHIGICQLSAKGDAIRQRTIGPTSVTGTCVSTFDTWHMAHMAHARL